MKKIKLTQNKFALIDDEDFDLVSQYKWHAGLRKHTYYAFNRRKNLLMHRLIMKVTDSKLQIDHINRNGLDNRKKNLRIVDNRKNSLNSRPKRNNKTSKYKGVDMHVCGKWRAVIRPNKKQIHLGLFNNEKDAALAYDKKAKILFGEYAFLNFPGENI